VFIGEIGLSGEVRAARFMENRIKEAQKLGFTKIICPAVEKVTGVVLIKNVSEMSKVFSGF
jgi:DNA repair protein RadA/Sms